MIKDEECEKLATNQKEKVQNIFYLESEKNRKFEQTENSTDRSTDRKPGP